MATITFRAPEDGALNTTIDNLFGDHSNVVDAFGDKLALIRGGAVGPFSSGSSVYVGIELRFDAFDDSSMDALRPLFRLVAALLEEQSGQPISVTITTDDGDNVEIHKTV